MRRLSISTAWEESKAIVARDGRLFVSVALALIALPTAITGLINPGGVTQDPPLWVDLVILLVSLVALAGQLSLIRLALAPSITVAGAIGHGFRRMPVYLLAALLILLGLVVLAVPFILAMAALGVPLTPGQARLPPTAALLMLIYLALVFFVAVRVVLAAPAASAERIGPVAIIRRAWALSSGHWWQLFTFLLMFFIGAVVLLLAVQAAVGMAVSLLLGPVEPLTLGALALSLVQALVNAVVTTLFAVMMARIYAQLSGRGEVELSVPSSGT